MKPAQITLRNVDTDLKRLIDQNARKRHKSINEYVLDVLRQSLGHTGATGTSKRWRQFSGRVPADGLDQATLDDFEKLDETMWR